MLPSDVAAFSDGLKAAFPAIRFVSVDYWQHFVDQKRWDADCREHRRREKLGLPRMRLRRYMRDPTGESLHYWDSLADPAERRFHVWIEPPGWRPVWGPEDEYGVRYIENMPRLWFQFQRSNFQLGWPRGGWVDVEPRPASGRDTLVLQGYKFLVRWNPREPEAEVFGKKVYNVLRKLAACEFKVFEPDSRRAYTAETWRMQKQCLAGRHALAWSLKRRHNYLKCDNWANLLKSADYRFRQGDIFTKAEYRQWRADQEERHQQNLRLVKEGMERLRGQPGNIEIEFRGGKFMGVRLIKPRTEPVTMPPMPEPLATPRADRQQKSRPRRGRTRRLNRP